MIEAVGCEFWRTYFGTIDRVLAPGGRVAIQAITMPHDRMLATRDTYTWINKYIFPGGFLPSVEVIDEITRRHTALRMAERLSMGSDYAETLRRWDRTLPRRARRVLALGFDEIFLRMWHFYLDYSQAGFASGYLDVKQLTFTRRGRLTTTRMPGSRDAQTSAGSPTGSPRRSGRSSAATCRCGCRPGTARWPGPPTRRSWCSAPSTRCAGCCGTRASSAPPRPT